MRFSTPSILAIPDMVRFLDKGLQHANLLNALSKGSTITGKLHGYVHKASYRMTQMGNANFSRIILLMMIMEESYTETQDLYDMRDSKASNLKT